MFKENIERIEHIEQIIKDAGGKIVGKLRLQKVVYLLQITGLENDNFNFVYKHYGPYSEGLAESARLGALLDNFEEEKKRTAWGSDYFVYKTKTSAEKKCAPERLEFAHKAANSSSIVLELVATAVYLFLEEGCADPWGETHRRKPEKTSKGRLKEARELFKELKKIVPKSLPDLPAPKTGL